MTRLVWFLTIFTLLLAENSARAERIYQLVNYPDLQNGHMLSGTITTTDDAPADGLLATEEILDWEWSITGDQELSAAYVPETLDTFSKSIVISPATMQLIPSTAADLRLWQSFPDSRGRRHTIRWLDVFDATNQTHRTRYSAGVFLGDVSYSYWSTELPASTGANWTIAIVVPEPSAAYLFAVGILTQAYHLFRRCVVA